GQAWWIVPHNSSDVWEWTAPSWELVGNGGPSPRGDTTMAYDASRDITVLFGGADTVPLGDTWQLATTLPTISQQPQCRTVRAGQPITLSVTAEGSAPFSYRWQRGAADLVDDGRI